MQNLYKFGTLILAGIAIVISSLALYESFEANKAARERNLPIVSAIITKQYDEDTASTTHTISVRNGGGPLQECYVFSHAIMTVELADEITHIELGLYFGDEVWTGNAQGLILTASREGNYSKYLSISSDFQEAARNDGREVRMWLIYFLSVSYEDYAGNVWYKYLDVGSRGSVEAPDIWARAILESSGRSRVLASSKGLTLLIDHLDGTELWSWYKQKILK